MPSSSSDRPYIFEMTSDFEDGLDELQPDHLRKAMRFLDQHARHTPTQAIPGQLKKLKGAASGYWQFRVNRSVRLIDAVDEERRVVRLEYLGGHPRWR